jgi:excisionase family DNA binding protein
LTDIFYFCINLSMNLITTKEAAEKLGVSVSRIQKMIWAEQIPAQKLGRDYFINEADLKLVEDRKPGRPSKAKTIAKATKTK